VASKNALARSKAAVAEAVDPHDEEAFNAWVDLYHDRIMSVTGIAPDPRDGDGCDGVTEEYYDVLWRIYRSGADAVATADDDLKDVPPEQRKNDQSADDFRKEWREAKERTEARTEEFRNRG